MLTKKPAEKCLGLLRPLALKLLPEKLLLCLLALERSVWSGDKPTQCTVPNKSATYPFLPAAEAAKTIIVVIYGLFLLLFLLFCYFFPPRFLKPPKNRTREGEKYKPGVQI